MSCIRIYLEVDTLGEHTRVKDKEIIHKLHTVLRKTTQERVYVFNGRGKEWECSIADITRNTLVLKKEKTSRQTDSPSENIILGVPLLRGEKFDFLLQKVTELGVLAIVPYISRYTAIRKAPPQTKHRRWQRIAQEAARQSERLWVPAVKEVCSFKDLHRIECAYRCYADRAGKWPAEVPQLRGEGNILVVIGSEGGFSKEEQAEFDESSWRVLKLSRGLLRTETAAIAAVTLMNAYAD